MLFDTPVYFVFLALTVLIYWQLKWRQQNSMLLIASYIFYGWWDWRFLGLIAISTIVDFHCAKLIASSVNPIRRKVLLTLSVSLNLAFLGVFKYYDFFAQSLHDSLAVLGISVSLPLLMLVLPPGISFYTFQELAYIVDVYFKKLEPAENFVDYALFISLFPHLIAGPIQRPGHLLPQVQRPRVFVSDNVYDGLMLIASGLLRKAVIADNCGLVADAAFGGKFGPPSIAVTLLGMWAFSWKIYGDFSGYSDIARGSAQLMGFHFMVNFEQPYLATSFREFWRRWHISLSTWLRDYLYKPLGGDRAGKWNTYRNLMATMLLGGLWHGANWTFVVWGAMQGTALAIERIGADLREKNRPAVRTALNLFSAKAWLQRVIVFHAVAVAWVFFRASSVHEAWSFLAGLTRWAWRPEYLTAFQFLAFFAIPGFVIDLMLEARREEYPFQRQAPSLRLATGLAMVAVVAFFAAGKINAFIYFQF